MSIGIDGISLGRIRAGSTVMVTSDWTVSDSVDSEWQVAASKETFSVGTGARVVTSSDEVTMGKREMSIETILLERIVVNKGGVVESWLLCIRFTRCVAAGKLRSASVAQLRVFARSTFI